MANTKVTGDLIASGTITAANLVSGTLDTLLNGYLTTNAYATESYVTTAVNNLIDAAPASLDTLNELAAALNDDANFATTVTDSIATKLPLAGGNITGNLSVDTNVLFVDTANDRVGIGTSSPNNLTHIFGGSDSQENILLKVQSNGVSDAGSLSTSILIANSTAGTSIHGAKISAIRTGTGTEDLAFYNFNVSMQERMRIDSSGNMGIGTSTPQSKLHLTGAITISDVGAADNTTLIQFTESSNYDQFAIKGDFVGTAGENKLKFTTDLGGGDILTMKGNGNVGIGSTTPQSRLHVAKASVTPKYVDAFSTIVIEDIEARLQLVASDGGSNAAAITLSNEANHWTIHHRGPSAGNYLGIGYVNTTDGSDIVSAAMNNLVPLAINTSGNVGVGTTSPSTLLQVGDIDSQSGNATLTVRRNGSGIEFGHNNRTSGYYGTIGAMANEGTPYIAFSADNDNSQNTFTTRGFKGNVIKSTTAGDLTFNQLTNANASGQSLTERMRITSGGAIGIGTTNPQYSMHFSSIGSVKIMLESDTDNFDESHNAGIIYSQDGGLVIGRTGFQDSTNSMEVWNTLGPVVFGAADVERMHISPDFGLISNNTTASDAGSKIFMDALNVDCGLMPVPAGGTLYLYNRSSGVNRRVLLSSSTYFTGQHGNKPIDTDLKNNIEKYVGLIVSSVGTYHSVNPITEEVSTGKDAITISEALPEIKLTDKDQDKAVWGVVTNVKNDNYNTDGTVEKDNTTSWGDRLGEDVIRVNGLGEGAIWITNINGDIENGDYICSSIIPGYGRKQNDDLLHNYTVAKATMDCDFDLNNNGLYVCEEFEFEGLTYKRAFIGCTYHCS